MERLRGLRNNKVISEGARLVHPYAGLVEKSILEILPNPLGKELQLPRLNFRDQPAPPLLCTGEI